MRRIHKYGVAAVVAAGAHEISKNSDKILDQDKRIAALEKENRRLQSLGELKVSIQATTSPEQVARIQKAIRNEWKKRAVEKRVELCKRYHHFLGWPLEVSDDQLPYIEALFSEIQAELKEDPVIASEFKIIGMKEVEGVVKWEVRNPNAKIDELLVTEAEEVRNMEFARFNREEKNRNKK